MIDVISVLNKISELEKSGKYNKDQIELIKYAMYRDGLDANFIMDPSIPGKYMETYIQLATRRKDISIQKYVNEGWHNKGFSPEQLYFIILADVVGVDIKNISPDMSLAELKETINSSISENRIQERYRQTTISSGELNIIKSLNISNSVKNYLLTVGENMDISELLSIDLENYSIEQIKYLLTVLSTGSDIKRISDPSLSPEEMREIIINSEESRQFMEEIENRHKSRK